MTRFLRHAVITPARELKQCNRFLDSLVPVFHRHLYASYDARRALMVIRFQMSYSHYIGVSCLPCSLQMMAAAAPSWPHSYFASATNGAACASITTAAAAAAASCPVIRVQGQRHVLVFQRPVLCALLHAILPEWCETHNHPGVLLKHHSPKIGYCRLDGSASQYTVVGLQNMVQYCSH